MTGPVRAAYDQLIAANELKRDPAQARAAGLEYFSIGRP